MQLDQQQSRALFVIGTALTMFALVLIPAVLVYYFG